MEETTGSKGGESRDSLNIWIVQAAEPIPGVDGDVRLGRCGLLAAEFTKRKHSVTWWSSCFNHFTKDYRYRQSTEISAADGLVVRMVYAEPGYRQNVSFSRVLNQRSTAKAFAREAHAQEKPDVIYTCLPTPDLAEQVVQIGVEWSVPVVIDVRDLWPDLYVSVAPKWLRPFVRILLQGEFNRAKRALVGASRITAVSQTYLEWAWRKVGRNLRGRDQFFPLGFRRPPNPNDDEVDGVRSRYGIPRGSFVAVFSGVFGRSYDLETVVDAARIMMERSEERIRIVLIGGGDKEAVVKKLADDLSNVVITGWLKQNEVFPILYTADVGLTCYTAEAFQSLPNKPFDYMAAGLGILNSLSGELWRLVEEKGIGENYAAGSGEALAEKLVWLRDNPKTLNTMRQNARKVFDESFSEERIYPRMADYIESVVS